MLFALACTPREIEQETMREMPRPGGSDQHRLDSIKRELNIKRQQQEEEERR
jgi:hypothetical protein